MSFITIIGVIAAGWAFLNVLGSERQKEITLYRRKLASEEEHVAEPARPMNVPGAAAPVHAPTPPPPAKPPPAKPPTGNKPK